MLDFGSRMSKDNKGHDEDDLFSSMAVDDGRSETFENVSPEEPVEKEIVKSSVAVEKAPVKSSISAEKEKSADDDTAAKTPVRFSFLRKAQNRDNDALEKLDTCKILRNARMEKGLSLEQVEAATQIRGKYLEALEGGDFKDLPQQVYVLAYLRKLCRLYGMSAQDEEELVQPWREVAREVPENLPASMIIDEDNENAKILRRLEFGFLAGGAIIVIGIVAFLVILAVSFFKKDPEPAPKFKNESLLELQEKPQLSMPVEEPVSSKR